MLTVFLRKASDLASSSWMISTWPPSTDQSKLGARMYLGGWCVLHQSGVD